MKALNAIATAAALLVAGAAVTVALPSAATAAEVPVGAKNIVLVPGSFVDGSGWRTVHDILWLKGYHITVAGQPHTSFADDVAATRVALAQQDGPAILVGHSSGAAVASSAGDDDKVKALVFVAGVLPDVGESLGQVIGSMPAPSNDIVATADGHLYFDRARFNADFAGDLTPNRSNFLAASQVPATAAAFSTRIVTAAWKNKPSYAIVSTEDRALSPDLQRWMYQRAGAKVTEVKGSHLVYIAQPEAVAKVIIEAAQSAR
jgi:pimeloyl-ACP methyl ester carboxylesterase